MTPEISWGCGLPGLELTENELEIAEASISFAIENCPIEGLLSNEDGTSISLDEAQALLEKLKAAENEPPKGGGLGIDTTTKLKIIIDYTSENCPVEAVATFHEGKPISGNDIATLPEKLRGASH